MIDDDNKDDNNNNIDNDNNNNDNIADLKFQVRNSKLFQLQKVQDKIPTHNSHSRTSFLFRNFTDISRKIAQAVTGSIRGVVVVAVGHRTWHKKKELIFGEGEGKGGGQGGRGGG